MIYKKPDRLKPGDTVAIVSLSSGVPSIFPHIFDNGLKILKKWGLKIEEYPTARMDATKLKTNPKLRARDLNNAFADKEIKAIITSIGGNDSVRILPYININIIKQNPKIFMGYSDTTAQHIFLNLNGLVSFYGPSIMAGFSQMKTLSSLFEKHVKNILFNPQDSYVYETYEKYCDGYPDWSDSNNLGLTNSLKKNDGWHWLQGDKKVQGELFGGCIEVLEMLKATDFWPERNFWKDKIFFLETSEEKPGLNLIEHILRNYGMLGIFDKINGLIFSRARDYSDKEKKDLESLLKSIVTDEFGQKELPIVANFDIGHTDPQLILPLGIKAEIDCKNKHVGLVESWLN